MSRRALIALSILAVVVLASFRVEGNPYFLADGQTEYFLTMLRCQREASSTFSEGGSRYSGYRCTRKFLWFTLEAQQFYNGKRTSTVR